MIQKVTAENFSEANYLIANPDVWTAVREGRLRSAREHFDRHGYKENRLMRFPFEVGPIRREKMRKIEGILRTDVPFERRNDKFDYLTDELRAATRISDTENVSSHDYDQAAMDLVNRYPDGLILDCGAGRRNRYFQNVVNYEIVDYDTTDVIGVGEQLPFQNDSFDGVLSIAVLEHVRDPFQCAREIVRVLKPGGQLVCAVPFLQPLHGYPHHYYNMTHQGLRALFEDALEIRDQQVTKFFHPIHALVWILASWAKGLEGMASRNSFLDLRVSDLLIGARQLHDADFVRELPMEKQFELACATMILADKPA